MSAPMISNISSALSSVIHLVEDATGQSNSTISHDSGNLKPCMLIQGPVALAAQLVLLAVVISALTFKRHRERPRRAMNVWLLDISKQGCSGMAGHAVGMGVAIVAQAYSKTSSQCGWYFVVYFADCSLGLTLALLFHKLVNGFAETMHYHRNSALTRKDSRDGQDYGHEPNPPWWEALVEIGNYGDPPNYRRWLIQVVGWVSCVVTARLIVGSVVVSNIPFLLNITTYMDTAFYGHADMYLFTVMVGIPVFVNIAQAWIQDQVLRYRRKSHAGGISKPVNLEHVQVDVVSSSMQRHELPSRSGRERNNDQ